MANPGWNPCGYGAGNNGWNAPSFPGASNFVQPNHPTFQQTPAMQRSNIDDRYGSSNVVGNGRVGYSSVGNGGVGNGRVGNGRVGNDGVGCGGFDNGGVGNSGVGNGGVSVTSSTSYGRFGSGNVGFSGAGNGGFDVNDMGGRSWHAYQPMMNSTPINNRLQRHSPYFTSGSPYYGRSINASASSSFLSLQESSAVSNQYSSSSGSNFPGHFQSTPANLHHPYFSPINNNDSGYFGLSSSRLQFQQNSPYAAYNNTADQSLPSQFSASHPGHNSAYRNQPRMDTRPSMDQSRSDNILFQHSSAPHQNSSNGSNPNTSLRQSTSSTTTGARPSDSALAIAALYASGNSSGLSGPEAQQRMNIACATSANQQPSDATDGRVCSNCGATSTPLWRRDSVDDSCICNACGLYQRTNGRRRPVDKPKRRTAATSNIKPDSVCSNCSTQLTSIWRKGEDGKPVCNACGLYYKLHKKNRPSDMNKEMIQRRRRWVCKTRTKKTDNNLPKINPDNNLPSTNTNNNLPSTNTNNNLPSTNTNNNLPSTDTNNNLPSTNTNNNLPSTNTNNNLPSTNAGNNLPSTNTINNIPSTNVNLSLPTTPANNNLPSTSADNNLPSTNTINLPSTNTNNNVLPSTNATVPPCTTANNIPQSTNAIYYRPSYY